MEGITLRSIRNLWLLPETHIMIPFSHTRYKFLSKEASQQLGPCMGFVMCQDCASICGNVINLYQSSQCPSYHTNQHVLVHPRAGMMLLYEMWPILWKLIIKEDKLLTIYEAESCVSLTYVWKLGWSNWIPTCSHDYISSFHSSCKPLANSN